MYYVGIDIGSTAAKTAIFEDDKLVDTFVMPTGWSSIETANAIKDKIISKGIKIDDAKIVATGYGRVSVPYAHKTITEITCHGKGVTISSMCTVFAESEVISLIGRGEKKEDIAYAIVDSIVSKVASLCKKHSDGANYFLTGGLCECNYIVTSLSKKLNNSVKTNHEARFAGAIGAGILAKNKPVQ